MNNTEDIVWITGASSGIGRALSLLYVRNGRTVAGSADDAEGLEQVRLEAHRHEGLFVPYPVDIRDPLAVRNTVDAIERDLGPMAIAVLGAGIQEPVTGQDMDPGAFRRLADVNIFGTVECLSAVVDHMRDRHSGQIAIISSLSGYIGQPRLAAYGMTKAALINLTQAFRLELADLGIKLQLITPGFVRSPMSASVAYRMPHILSADEAAVHIHKGLATDSFEISFPWQLKLTVKLMRLLPLNWAQAIGNRSRRR